MFMIKCNLFIMLIALTLCGCGLHATFKENTSQGQLLPDAAVSQLKEGMSTAEVTNIIGSTLLYNINDNRWEYLQYKRVRGNTLVDKHLILHFDDGKLTKIEQF